MACPTIKILGKSVILLSGFRDVLRDTKRARVIKSDDINSAEALSTSAKRHPDAVAFGYVAGRWVPVA
jgi:hypothetical protein